MINKFFKNKIKNGSKSTDKVFIDNAYSNQEFPFLISFPRTGSHWLRMLMELYFEKPALTRSFYYHNSDEFTCLHHHDIEINLCRKNIIYLYRNPVDTIFSQLNYHKEECNDLTRIKYWSLLYGLHLEKYLISDNFSTKKTIIKYENLLSSMSTEFKKICEHLNYNFSEEQLISVAAMVNKKKLKQKTKHDNQVVNLSTSYEAKRRSFKENHKNYILNFISSINSNLKNII